MSAATKVGANQSSSVWQVLGQEISTRPFQLVTGRVWKGSAFGGVKGRSELPGYVERYLAGEIPLQDFITHTMPIEDINEAFDLMHKGESIGSVVILQSKR